jgi:hypothetical protein
MAYAYRDKYGILHCTEHKNTAEKYAAGNIVAYDGPCQGGYPVLDDGVEIFDYGAGEVYVGGNRGNGARLEDCSESIKNAVADILAKIGL